MNTLCQDIRFGARMLVKSPGFSAIAIVTLALGIGANTAIFSVVDGILLRPLALPNSDRIVVIREVGSSTMPTNTSYATFLDWKARNRSLEDISAFKLWNTRLTGESEPRRILGLAVTSEFFTVMGVRPFLGRDFLPLDDRPGQDRVVILSHELWEKAYASDPGVLGKIATLGNQPYTVIGVMPDDFPSIVSSSLPRPADVWVPLRYDPADSSACRTCRHLQAVGLLGADVSLDAARADLGGVSNMLVREYPDSYSSSGVDVITPQELLVAPIRPALLVLLGAVALVALICCANVANLALTRAAARGKEFAMRATLGADRSRLFRQLLTEGVVLALIGGIGGIFLAFWGQDALLSLAPADLLRRDEIGINLRVLGFTIVASIGTGLICGLVPAFVASRPNLNDWLRQSGGATTVLSKRLRSLLVVSELALACVLLIGGGLLTKSFTTLVAVEPGFSTQNLLTMPLFIPTSRYPSGAERLAFYREVKREIELIPGVSSADLVTVLPFGANRDRIGFHLPEWSSRSAEDAPAPDRFGIGTGYLKTMGIPLLQGRNFTLHDALGSDSVMLVSSALANAMWPNESPLGKRAILGAPTGQPRTIVGVVGDVRHRSLDTEPTMQVYLPHAQWPASWMTLVVRTTVDPMTLVGAMRDGIWAIDTDQPIYDVATMDELIARTCANRQFAMVLLLVFAGCSLVLSAIGLYGVLSYTIGQRLHEIGIRMALGAEHWQIRRMVVGQGMMMALFGVGVGLLTAITVTSLLRSLLYGISATDPTTFAAVAFLVISVAAVACYIPARRATKVEPVVALRSE